MEAFGSEPLSDKGSFPTQGDHEKGKDTCPAVGKPNGPVMEQEAGKCWAVAPDLLSDQRFGYFRIEVPLNGKVNPSLLKEAGQFQEAVPFSSTERSVCSKDDPSNSGQIS